MAGLADLEFVKCQEPLGPYTDLKLGGLAEFLVQPRSREELAARSPPMRPGAHPSARAGQRL